MILIEFRTNRRLRFTRTLSLVLVLCCLLSGVFICVDLRLREIAKAFAKSTIKTILLNSANETCEKVLSEFGVTYDDLAVISRNEEGYATSVEIDSVAASRLKARIMTEMSESAAKTQDVSFSLPISAAFGLYYSYLSWPQVEYTVNVTTTVGANFKSTFTGAGINQVLHQILLSVTLESDLSMLGDNTAEITSTDFIIAQTVIVGVVPDAFTSVGHATDEVMEDIFDFGASVK